MEGIKGTEHISDEELLADLHVGGRIRFYHYVVSVVFLSVEEHTGAVFTPAGKLDWRRWAYSGVSLVAGWWSFPFGPILTLDAVAKNFDKRGSLTSPIRNQLMATFPHVRPDSPAPFEESTMALVVSERSARPLVLLLVVLTVVGVVAVGLANQVWS